MRNLEQTIIDYWNNQPCNIKHSDYPVGTQEYFDAVSNKRYRAEPHILDFAGFHLWRGKRVLEIGCGIGTDGEQFARHGADYVGFDISQSSLNVAKQRFQLMELPGEFVHGSITDTDIVSQLGEFDLVYSYGVLHHFPGMREHLETIHKLVAPQGEFRFMVYAKNSWKMAMIKKGLDQFEAQANCPYADAYTKEEIVTLMDGLFQEERIRQDHCFMYNIPEYKKGNFVLEPWFELMSPIMRDAIKEYLGWHLLVKARKI